MQRVHAGLQNFLSQPNTYQSDEPTWIQPNPEKVQIPPIIAFATTGGICVYGEVGMTEVEPAISCSQRIPAIEAKQEKDGVWREISTSVEWSTLTTVIRFLPMFLKCRW